MAQIIMDWGVMGDAEDEQKVIESDKEGQGMIKKMEKSGRESDEGMTGKSKRAGGGGGDGRRRE